MRYLIPSEPRVRRGRSFRLQENLWVSGFHPRLGPPSQQPSFTTEQPGDQPHSNFIALHGPSPPVVSFHSSLPCRNNRFCPFATGTPLPSPLSSPSPSPSPPLLSVFGHDLASPPAGSNLPSRWTFFWPSQNLVFGRNSGKTRSSDPRLPFQSRSSATMCVALTSNFSLPCNFHFLPSSPSHLLPVLDPLLTSF